MFMSNPTTQEMARFTLITSTMTDTGTRMATVTTMNTAIHMATRLRMTTTTTVLRLDTTMTGRDTTLDMVDTWTMARKQSGQSCPLERLHQLHRQRPLQQLHKLHQQLSILLLPLRPLLQRQYPPGGASHLSLLIPLGPGSRQNSTFCKLQRGDLLHLHPQTELQ